MANKQKVFWGVAAASLLVVILGFLIVPHAFAQISITPPPGAPKEIKEILQLLVNLIVGVSGAIFIMMLLLGGIQYLSGAGNEATTKVAKQRLLDAVIGLIITLAAFGVGTFILNRLGVNTNSTGTPGTASTAPAANNDRGFFENAIDIIRKGFNR